MIQDEWGRKGHPLFTDELQVQHLILKFGAQRSGYHMVNLSFLTRIPAILDLIIILIPPTKPDSSGRRDLRHRRVQAVQLCALGFCWVAMWCIV